MTWTQLAIWTTLCLVLEAFFSGSELALVASDKMKLTHQAARGHRGARIALALSHRPEWLFSATLLGQNLFIVANSVLITFFIFSRFGEAYEIWGLLLSPLVLIFGEAVPKTVFQQRADHLTPVVAPVILAFSYLFYPVVWGLSKLALLLMGGVKGSLVAGHEVTHESLEVMLRESEIQRDLSPVFKKSLMKILAFAKKDTHEVMTPLVEVFSLRDTTTVEDAIVLCREEGYSSIPVFQKRGYNIVGVVTYHRLMSAKDLSSPLSESMETPLYVSEDMSVRDLYLYLREQKKSFAVVADEYGSSVGIVTMEDIIEEILGEIQDEYDDERPSWRMTAPRQYLFSGRVKIDDINERLRWRLPKGNFETLAGFLLSELGHLPKSGEMVHYGNLTLMVKSATPRAIEEVLVEVG